MEGGAPRRRARTSGRPRASQNSALQNTVDGDHSRKKRVGLGLKISGRKNQPRITRMDANRSERMVRPQTQNRPGLHQELRTTEKEFLNLEAGNSSSRLPAFLLS